MKGGKCGDSFYVRTHFAHKSDKARQQPQGQQQELSFLAGDIFHVTDTLFGGSPGWWQVTKVKGEVEEELERLFEFIKVYSAADAEPKGGQAEPNAGIIPHAKVAEMLLRRQRQAERAGGEGGGGEAGGTLGRNLFRKKVGN